MKQKMHILVVEDEPAIQTGLVDVLVFHGYDVQATGDGKEGLDLALTGKFDLVLLDIMLPSMNGFDVCNAIRQADRDQPVIMLTAKISDEDIIHGLKLGADDYVAKPFSIEQLVLRIGAVLRRSRSGKEQANRIVLRCADRSLDISTENLSGNLSAANGDVDRVAFTRREMEILCYLHANGDVDRVAFTRREMEILCYLHANAERPVSRDELLNQVWGYARNLDIETRTVDIHVAKLRRKIEVEPKQPKHLCTVRGAGYRLHSEV